MSAAENRMKRPSTDVDHSPQSTTLTSEVALARAVTMAILCGFPTPGVEIALEIIGCKARNGREPGCGYPATTARGHSLNVAAENRERSLEEIQSAEIT